MSLHSCSFLSELGIEPHLNQVLIPPHASSGTNSSSQPENSGGSELTSESTSVANPDTTGSQQNP